MTGIDANDCVHADLTADSEYAPAFSDGTVGNPTEEVVSETSDRLTDAAIDANVLIALATAGTLFCGAGALRRRTR